MMSRASKTHLAGRVFETSGLNSVFETDIPVGQQSQTRGPWASCGPRMGPMRPASPFFVKMWPAYETKFETPGLSLKNHKSHEFVSTKVLRISTLENKNPVKFFHCSDSLKYFCHTFYRRLKILA